LLRGLLPDILPTTNKELLTAIESSEKKILTAIEGDRAQLDDLHETIKPQLRGINWLIAAFKRLGAGRN
jgi:hypothetical protein